MSVLCKTEEIIVDTNEYNSDEGDENIRLGIEDSGGETYQTTTLTTSNVYHTEQHSSSRGVTTTTLTTAGGGSGSTTPQRQRNILPVSRNIVTPSSKNTTKSLMESEKRMRREIANSNERRRMQSINAGFQSLRSLLPHHEGEKLSKAAILQQTAQYIIDLEREKTHLLSQNSQLKRLLGQHEIGCSGSTGGASAGGTENGTAGAIKKRKLADNVMTIQTISDSSDEGLGSMSPEPVALMSSCPKIVAGTYISSSAKELNELKARLEAEHKRRSVLEDRIRQLEGQIYSNHHYIQREVIEHTDNIRDEEMAVTIINDPLKLQVVEIDSLPTVGQTQVVVCSSLEELQEAEEAETITEEIIHTSTSEEMIIPEEYVEVPSRLQPILEAAIKAEPKVEVERINSNLTKIKSEPSIDEEVCNTVQNNNTIAGGNGNSTGRMYLTSTSRQNLETIVEAIRHLEGDHLFDMVEQKKVVQTQQSPPQRQQLSHQQKQSQQQHQQKSNAQEVPLALTTAHKIVQHQSQQQQIQQQQQQQPQQQIQIQSQSQAQQRKISVALRPYLQLKNNGSVTIVGGTGAASLTTKGTVVSTASEMTAISVANSNTCSNNSNSSNNSIKSTISNSNTSSNNNISSSNIINGSGNKVQTVGGGTATTVSTVQLLSPQQKVVNTVVGGGGVSTGATVTVSSNPSNNVTITASSLKQCRPGVIVAKQIS